MKTAEEIKDKANDIYSTHTNAIYEVNIKRVKQLQNEAFCVGAGYALTNLWIDAYDHLPEDSEEVLTLDSNNIVQICTFLGGKFYDQELKNYHYTQYWMPIPNPPKD